MAAVKKGKRFRYNLETVLKVRKIKEGQEQEKFSQAQAAYEDEQHKAQQMREARQAEYASFMDYMSGTEIDPMRIMMHKHYLNSMDSKIEEQEQKVEEARQVMEAQRKELIKAVQDRKVIDKDKEKKKEQWVKLMKKEDDKFLDDITSVKYARQPDDA